MIKAEFKGISDEILGCELVHGKVYPISTYCEKNKLIVRVMRLEFQYRNLEEFCKYWRVRAVYREQSRKA